jgi:hypothetical protein
VHIFAVFDIGLLLALEFAVAAFCAETAMHAQRPFPAASARFGAR